MYLDIGLHLLGGDPMGYYRQPREVQIDLLAYWQVMNDSKSNWRWASFAPARLGDISLHAIRSGFTETMSGFRAWLKGRGGVRFRAPQGSAEFGIVSQAKRQLQMSNAKRCGATKKATSFWLG